jgi:hypothetical protein
METMSRSILADLLLACIIGTAFGWGLGIVLEACLGGR